VWILMWEKGAGSAKVFMVGSISPGSAAGGRSANLADRRGKSASFVRMPRTGSDETRLIILRGNSASGKSSTAAEIRRRYGRRDLAIVGQDNLRRDVLREHDVPGGANIRLIGLVARYALSHGFNAIVEGIFCTDHYAEMLMTLIGDHQGPTCCYYFDVPFDETLRRHATKPQAGKYGATEMRAWYRELDLLPGGIEQIIPAEIPQDKIVRRIMADSGLAAEAAQEARLADRASTTTPAAAPEGHGKAVCVKS
jgi:hypothetical protein